jgi:hypothetical protein
MGFIEDLIDDLVIEYVLEKMPEFKQWAITKAEELAASTESRWDDRAAAIVRAFLTCENEND